MELILIRHAEADYSTVARKDNPDVWKNFANLSVSGIQQAETIAEICEQKGAELILTSPYTRAFETAHIISRKANIPLKVEFDLREWDHEYSKQFNEKDFQELLNEMKQKKGKYSLTCKYKWESLDKLGERVFNAVLKYRNHKKIIVVTHMMVIGQFEYKDKIGNGEIVEIGIDESSKPNGYVEA